MKQKVLYTSSQVRHAIQDVFSAHGKRVAITAFVGADAEAYLPNPEGIHLVCWPQPGSTNPDTLNELHRLGVRIEFADKLHMKVYWSSKGAVISLTQAASKDLAPLRIRVNAISPAFIGPGAMWDRDVHPRCRTRREAQGFLAGNGDQRERHVPLLHPHRYGVQGLGVHGSRVGPLLQHRGGVGSVG